jgi:head-tail adaptor
MKVAELRHVVYIQTATVTTSARGAESVTWADSPRLRAKVQTVSGDERNRNEQVTAVATHEVTLRWPLPAGTTMTTKSRVKWTQDGITRYFGVTFVGEPDNRRRVVVLACQELVGESRGI